MPPKSKKGGGKGGKGKGKSGGKGKGKSKGGRGGGKKGAAAKSHAKKKKKSASGGSAKTSGDSPKKPAVMRGIHNSTVEAFKEESCGQTYPPSKLIRDLSFDSRATREAFDPDTARLRLLEEQKLAASASMVSDVATDSSTSIDRAAIDAYSQLLAEATTSASLADSKKKSIVEVRRTREGLLSVHQIDALEKAHFPVCCDVKSASRFPLNQTLPHPTADGFERLDSEDKAADERQMVYQQKIESLREAAEIHRQIRQATQQFIKPGKAMIDIVNFVEKATQRLTGYDASRPMERGYGFPTGCSLNECAAHYTPNPGDKTVLKYSDICKIDFGVQINGHIIDCAFSFSFDPVHDDLMHAVKAATNAGVKAMGIDARLGDVGAAIQEVMESYQCFYKGKYWDVKSIENLHGHNIAPWKIHGGKSVPIVKRKDDTKMEEGELYAIETFGSVMGNGKVDGYGDCSHFALTSEALESPLKIDHKATFELFKFISKRFGTIPFCRRWLEDEGCTRHLMSLKRLVDWGLVRDYPPLMELPGSYTAQYEHTILLRPTCKEVLSRGTDF